MYKPKIEKDAYNLILSRMEADEWYSSQMSLAEVEMCW